MTLTGAWEKLAGTLERETHRPDGARALRATVATMAPLLLALSGHLPLEAAFTVIAAQSMAMIDVRGAYAARLGFLLIMVLILTGSTWLGGLTSNSIGWSIAATAVIALNAGLWRHLTPEYGPSMAAPAALLFFVAAFSSHPGPHAASALVGSIWGLLVQVASWCLRPQHPLRRALADSWLATADLFAAIASEKDWSDPPARQQRIAAGEIGLRETLERSYAQLSIAAGTRRGAIPQPFEELQRLAARLATRLVALTSVLDGRMSDRAFAGITAPLESSIESLAQGARSVALAVVSRQPAHLALAEVRLRRAGSLLRALLARIEARPRTESERNHASTIIHQIIAQLREIAAAVRAATDRADERALFAPELRDPAIWRLRPLAAVLNLSPRPSPAILRFTARISLFLMLAVLIAKTWRYPHILAHAYWLPYTIVVVLQPDYGATRAKAAQRLWGTVAGSIAGTLILMLRLPLSMIVLATAAVGAIFAFFLRRNYAVAVVFITIFVVFLTESFRPATIELMIERLTCTVAGGVLALAGALVFWPSWEQTRFPAMLAAALTANRDYLKALYARLGSLIVVPDSELAAAKRKAESANQKMFGSLARLFADPVSHRAGSEQAPVLANGSLRLTRALNLLLVQAGSASLSRAEQARLSPLVRQMIGALDLLVDRVENPGHAAMDSVSLAADQPIMPDRDARAHPLLAPLAGAQVEISAMLAALPPPRTTTPALNAPAIA
jgi:uncharacterized membrane protein YccC